MMMPEILDFYSLFVEGEAYWHPNGSLVIAKIAQDVNGVFWWLHGGNHEESWTYTVRSLDGKHYGVYQFQAYSMRESAGIRRIESQYIETDMQPDDFIATKRMTWRNRK